MSRLLAVEVARWVGALSLCLSLCTSALNSVRSLAAEEIDYNLYETPARPTPEWVRMIDQGTLDPDLAGIMTPEGVKVEVVAREPVVLNPVGMAFDDFGTPYVLEWRIASESKHDPYQETLSDGTQVTINRWKKNVGDELKTLTDSDGDGRYDRADVRLNDLEIPSTLLLHDGWLYTASIGKVFRRKFVPPDGPFGSPQEVVRGLCGFNQHQSSGLALSHDGWMFISAGDDDNHAEGTDGSRADVLRCGAVFRCRPDGSHVAEFARGFRNPYRDVVFDEHFNMFHIDNDQEDGSKFQGVRLIHVQDGADYGWRLAAGNVCCRVDAARAAAFGESPGKMPGMLKTGRGAPAGLMIYQGAAFPGFFRGLLIYPDVYRKLVRAYVVERTGSTFAVTHQFTLMSSEEGLFRPCQAVQGPDGAIYIVDWRTDSGGAGNLWGDEAHGRIYKLSWSGTADVPAIPLGPLDAWSKLPQAEDETLWSLLDSPDSETRKRAQRELVRRGVKNRDRFLQVAASTGRSAAARIMAIGGACQMFNRDVYEKLIRLLKDEHAEVRRSAADALSQNAPTNSHEAIAALGEAMRDPHPAVARAAALGFGQLTSILHPQDSHRLRLAEQMRNTLAACDREDVFLYDGMLRGLERMGQLGIEKLLLWVWSNDDAKCETAVTAFEGLRTADAAYGLEKLLQGDTDFTDEQAIRLMRCYRNILIEPPISAARVAEWFVDNPEASVEVKIAGLETLGVVGGADPAKVQELASELLKHEDSAARRSAVQAIGANSLVALAPALLAALQAADRDVQERREIVAALARLRSKSAAFTGKKSPPGVELILDDLLKLANDSATGEIRGDILAVVAQVDYAKAEPLALEFIKSDDIALAAAAIDVLGTKPERAAEIGQSYADGKIKQELLPKVAAALQKHAEKEEDVSGPLHALLTEVFRGALLVSLEPQEVQRVESLVRTTGDPTRGRSVYLDSKRSQCAKCHRLEGIGGQIGPDLSKVWQTHTIAKILESMIDPSKEIKEGFATWVVTTKDGQIHAGLKMMDDKQEVVLRDAAGKDIRIPAGEIEDKEASKQSLMPDGVIALLKFQEFVDLVAFLKDKQAQESLRELPADGSGPAKKDR